MSVRLSVDAILSTFDRICFDCLIRFDALRFCMYGFGFSVRSCIWFFLCKKNVQAQKKLLKKKKRKKTQWMQWINKINLKKIKIYDYIIV